MLLMKPLLLQLARSPMPTTGETGSLRTADAQEAFRRALAGLDAALAWPEYACRLDRLRRPRSNAKAGSGSYRLWDSARSLDRRSSAWFRRGPYHHAYEPHEAYK
jgi:hypothetical protein